jgi:hypothetical protein
MLETYMALTDAKKEIISNIIEIACCGGVLTADELNEVVELTLGDMIVEMGVPYEKAVMAIKGIEISAKKNQAKGFRYPPKALKEARILRECGEMDWDMMGTQTTVPSNDMTHYHPEENEEGGMDFEDSDSYEEAGMVKSNLYNTATKAAQLHDMIGDADDVPEWVQEKIAVMSEYASVIHDYLTYEYKRGKE